jgi:membrane protease YdiL (CAAX protease family)
MLHRLRQSWVINVGAWLFIVGGAHSVIARITGMPRQPTLLRTLAEVPLTLVALGAALGILMRHKGRRVPVGLWLLLLPAATVFQASFALAFGLLSPITPGLELQPIVNGQAVALSDLSPQLIIWGVVSTVIAAPVIEEAIFRGWLLPQRPSWSAIALTAGLFALLHLPALSASGVLDIVPIFIIGVVLGYLMKRWANLWLCVLLHAAINTVPLLAVWALVALGWVPLP